MDCGALRDDRWDRIKVFMPVGTKGRRGPRRDNRTFLDALLWTARSGGRWRDLPELRGDDRSAKRRYYHRIEMGVLDEMLAVLAREADLEWPMIVSSIVRAHQHAAGTRKVKGQRMPKARAGLGGGLSTTIHAASAALGLPVRLIGSPGQRNDIALAHQLIEENDPDATIADKRSDADHLVDRITQTGADAVIPPEHNRIERFFSKLKPFRRVAPRCDKLHANVMGFVKLAAMAVWLK
ncbi:IS5 family transposase [Xanthobacter sp. V4C-4]|uniref:IS5 family transposase n=1 Tax=Xanthobacter cornucopiae TaxID=3119924 RepID=UPI00372A2CE3